MKDGVMINAQAYHDTSLSNLLLTEKCSTGLSVNYKCRKYSVAGLGYRGSSILSTVPTDLKNRYYLDTSFHDKVTLDTHDTWYYMM